MTLQHKLAITGIGMVAVGLVSLTPFVVPRASAPAPETPTPAVTQQQQAAPQPAVPSVISGKPVRLEVPAAAIDIAVIDGAYNPNTGDWTLTDTKAQFALPTRLPNNESGNTLIYGHDTPAIFNRLHKLTPGAEARVYTDNGHVLTYKLRSSEIVSPTNVSIFDYQGKPQLTLQTCTGARSENRKFFYFDLVSAQ